MKFHANVYDLAIENNQTVKEIASGKFSEIYILSLHAGQETGQKSHQDKDKTYVIVEGQGAIVIDGMAETFLPDDLILLPTGTTYNIKNTGTGDLKMFAICSFAVAPKK